MSTLLRPGHWLLLKKGRVKNEEAVIAEITKKMVSLDMNTNDLEYFIPNEGNKAPELRGYFFVRISQEIIDNKILNGINAQQINEVDSDKIEELKLFIDNQGEILEDTDFHIGDRVIVQNENFKGLEGVVDKLYSSSQKVSVKILFLGQSFFVELDNNEIKKVKC